MEYLISNRGSWTPHVERRVAKADKWDGEVRTLLGKTDGPLVSAVAMVREANAETRILYGCEFAVGTGKSTLEAATRRQVQMAKEILGLRSPAGNVGALRELRWMVGSHW